MQRDRETESETERKKRETHTLKKRQQVPFTCFHVSGGEEEKGEGETKHQERYEKKNIANVRLVGAFD